MVVIAGSIAIIAVSIASIFFWIGVDYGRKQTGGQEQKDKFYNVNRV